MTRDDGAAPDSEVETQTHSVAESPGSDLSDAGDDADGQTHRPSGIRRHAVAIALTGWLYFTQYRADQQTDAAARDSALDAAKTGTVALLSYSPDTLDEDFRVAKSHLTGEFLDYYTDFTQKVVAPAAAQKSVNTEAKVVLGAVSDLHPDNAEVLLFINQTTTSQENPDGAFAASSVKVGLTKIDGNWLIDSFDPV